MSTRAICPDKDALVSYLYDEYDGSELYDRREMEQHLDACPQCAADVAALGGVRQQLREWTAPENLPLGFRMVREPAAKRRWWSTGSIPFPLAAAAALVLGAGLGMARLDIQYDAQGFRIRTGWGHEDSLANGAAATARGSAAPSALPAAGTGAGPLALPAAGAQPVSAAALGAGAFGGGLPIGSVSGVLAPNAPSAPWRAELQTFERQIRQELAALRQSEGRGGQVTAASVIAGDPAGTRPSDAALIQRIQQMIDQSEVRQQQNLALRVAELSREFDMQRRSDLVRIEQSFGRLNDQREQDATQQRLLLNAIRVSQQKPQP